MPKEKKSVVINTMQVADALKCQHHKIMKRLEAYLQRHPEYKTDIILTNGYRAGFNMAFQIVIGLITFGTETAKC